MPAYARSHFLLHAILVSLILLILSLWHRSALVVWTPQALAVVAIVYLVFNRFLLSRWVASHEDWVVTIESLAALIVTVELAELTGGLAGPFGWLSYLLIVWLTLQLETPIAVVAGLGLVAFFLPGTSLFFFHLIPRQFAENPQLVFSDAVRLTGLLFTIPLALYIGHRHLRRKLKDQISEIKS